jgi:hypothetical protein
MKLSDWAGIAEIFSGIAVVVTLVFLIIGIRENTEVTRAATYADLLDGLNEYSMQVAANLGTGRENSSWRESHPLENGARGRLQQEDPCQIGGEKYHRNNAQHIELQEPAKHTSLQFGGGKYASIGESAMWFFRLSI